MGALQSYLTLLVLSPFIVLALHLMLLRSIPEPRRPTWGQRSAAAAILLGCPVTGFLSWPLIRQSVHPLPIGIYGLIVYFALGYSYFHAYNLGETARRLRLLYEIWAHGEIQASALKGSYTPSRLVDIRIERLLALGQISRENGRHKLESRLLWVIARAVLFWARVLGFK